MTGKRVSGYAFSQVSLKELKRDSQYLNWPVIYILEGCRQAYVGETTSAIRRIGTHLNDEHRKLFSRLYLIKDDTFYKSVTLDLVSSLIEFIPDELRSHRIVTNSIRDIRNSDLFKYSPYKVLTDDQAEIVEELEHVIREEDESVSIVEGEPGSGKTILAIYLVKYLLSGELTAGNRVAIVLPQTSLRETVRQIFRNVAGLKMSMVLGPTDVANAEEHFDVIIVDEQEQSRTLRHRDRQLPASMECYDGELDQQREREQRSRLHPSRPGLRTELRGRDHWPGVQPSGRQTAVSP